MPLIDLNGLGHFKSKENAMVADTYSASKTYAVGDYVYYNGTLYRCTTAIATAEAWTAAHWTAAKLADDLTAQSEAIKAEDEYANYYHKFINYSYDSPITFIADGDSTGVTQLGVVRNQNIVTLNNLKANTSNLRIKLNGEVKRTTSATTVNNWDRIPLTTGHKYRMVAKKLSGTYTIDSVDTAVRAVVYRTGENSTIGEEEVGFDYNARTFIAEENYLYCIALNVPIRAVINNAKFLVTLEDLSLTPDLPYKVIPEAYLNSSTGKVVSHAAPYEPRLIEVKIVGGKRYCVKKDTPTRMRVITSTVELPTENADVSAFARFSNSNPASNKPLFIQSAETDTHMYIQLFAEDDVNYQSIAINTVGLTVTECDCENVILHYKSLNDMVEINHRGFNTIAPENTIPAFKLSKLNGYEYIETDIRLTSDGKIVCLHDASINRTARNSDGTEISGTVNIASITYAQSQEYDFGVWKSSAYAGTKIPTLEEVVALCKNIGLGIVIEIKITVDATILAQITDIVHKYAMEDNVAYIGDKTTCTFLASNLENCTIGLVGSDSNTDSDLSTYLQGLMINGNTIRLHTDVYSSDATRRGYVDACAAEGVKITARANTLGEASSAPPYTSWFISNVIHPKEVIYNNTMP